jgi:hypothetical protein
MNEQVNAVSMNSFHVITEFDPAVDNKLRITAFDFDHALYMSRKEAEKDCAYMIKKRAKGNTSPLPKVMSLHEYYCYVCTN